MSGTGRSEPIPVVLATHNPHKVIELRRILGPALAGIELRGYEGPEPVETGTSFEQNALLKARAAARHTGLAAIADDSGIAVDLLGGAPGIFSARWSGPAKDARANLELLLWQLQDVPDEHRGARFVAAAALVVGDREQAVVGQWPGRILREPRGEHGFGYDPVFAPDDAAGRSAAELSDVEKDARSHRRRAFELLLPRLRQALGVEPVQ